MSERDYILLVEDKPRNVAHLRAKLDKNYRVELRRTLNGAWQLIEEGAPVLAILDLYLPTEFDKVEPCDGYKFNGFNQGQLLGCHLEKTGIPHLYLTNHRGFYEGTPPDNRVFEKDEIDEVLNRVDEILGAPTEIHRASNNANGG